MPYISCDIVHLSHNQKRSLLVCQQHCCLSPFLTVLITCFHLLSIGYSVHFILLCAMARAKCRLAWLKQDTQTHIPLPAAPTRSCGRRAGFNHLAKYGLDYWRSGHGLQATLKPSLIITTLVKRVVSACVQDSVSWLTAS